MTPTHDQAEGMDLSEAQLLFEALREHRTGVVRDSAAKGLASVKARDPGAANTALEGVIEGLRGWELHPALSRQIRLAEASLNPEKTPEQAPAVNKPASAVRSTYPTPSM